LHGLPEKLPPVTAVGSNLAFLLYSGFRVPERIVKVSENSFRPRQHPLALLFKLRERRNYFPVTEVPLSCKSISVRHQQRQ
jgi:hypothetical protein